MIEVATPKKVVKKSPISEAKSQQSEAKRSNFYAVFATGGKQYRVKMGDKVKIEKLSDENKEGDKITFDKVLLIDDGATDVTLGTPFIKGGEVKATLTKIARYKTIDVIKYKQKSRYFKKNGHRQPFFKVQINSIA